MRRHGRARLRFRVGTLTTKKKKKRGRDGELVEGGRESKGERVEGALSRNTARHRRAKVVVSKKKGNFVIGGPERVVGSARWERKSDGTGIEGGIGGRGDVGMGFGCSMRNLGKFSSGVSCRGLSGGGQTCSD